MQPVNVRVGIAAVEDAETVLVTTQATGAGQIAGEKDRHRQLEVGKQLIVQRIQLFDPFEGKRPAGRQRFVSDFTPHAFDDIGGLLQVERHLYDLRPAAGLFFRQLIFWHPRQIELDGGIEHVDVIRELAQRFLFPRFAVHHLFQPLQHLLHGIAHAQRFPSGIGQRQRRGIQS